MLEVYAAPVEMKATSCWLDAGVLVDRMNGVYHLGRPRADHVVQALLCATAHARRLLPRHLEALPSSSTLRTLHCDHPLSLQELQQLCTKHTSLRSVRVTVLYAALPEQQLGVAEAQLFLEQVQSDAAVGMLQQALDALGSLAAQEELSLTVGCELRADLVAELPAGLAARLRSLQLAVKEWGSRSWAVS
jgi:hypothetical protein